MPRNICITAVDGQTGFAVVELLLSSPDFSKKVNSVVGLTLHPQSARAKEAKSLGVKIVPHAPGRESAMIKTLKDTHCDTICLVPPTHKDKFDITEELINATKRAGIPNVCFFSSVGCDYADPKRQPRLREFLDLETLVLASKGDSSTETGHSPVVIRYVLSRFAFHSTSGHSIKSDVLMLVPAFTLRICLSTRLKRGPKASCPSLSGRITNLLL